MFGRYSPIWTKSSLIRCNNKKCHNEWRTTAKYVESIPWDEGADVFDQASSTGNEGVKPA